MKKQRRGLNKCNMLQDGKMRKKDSIHMHATCTLKTNCEEKKRGKKKTTTKNGVNGIRTHIHENRRLLLKHERSTHCAIKSLV